MGELKKFPQRLVLQLRETRDVAVVQSMVLRRSKDLDMPALKRTRLATAASELARNMVVYGGGGTAVVDSVERDAQQGIRIAFTDEGPGIADVELALRDGYTSGRGLGLGLGGARRLVDEFVIETSSSGTKVMVTQWR